MEFAGIAARLGESVPKALLPVGEDDHHLSVRPKGWLKVAQQLRDDPELHFDSLMCLTGNDRGPGETLWVAYNFHSMDLGHKLEVRIEVPREGGSIPSVANIWRTADWHEREAFDLFGINFEGHPDLRRILLPFDWKGHPLLKDFVTPEYYRGMPVPKDKRGWE